MRGNRQIQFTQRADPGIKADVRNSMHERDIPALRECIDELHVSFELAVIIFGCIPPECHLSIENGIGSTSYRPAVRQGAPRSCAPIRRAAAFAWRGSGRRTYGGPAVRRSSRPPPHQGAWRPAPLRCLAASVSSPHAPHLALAFEAAHRESSLPSWLRTTVSLATRRRRVEPNRRTNLVDPPPPTFDHGSGVALLNCFGVIKPSRRIVLRAWAARRRASGLLPESNFPGAFKRGSEQRAFG